MTDEEVRVCPKHKNVVLFRGSTAVSVKDMLEPVRPNMEWFIQKEERAWCPKCKQTYFKSECKRQL